jgi:hypothetical protein
MLDSKKSKNSALMKRAQENTLTILPGKPLEDTSSSPLLCSFEMKLGY